MNLAEDVNLPVEIWETMIWKMITIYQQLFEMPVGRTHYIDHFKDIIHWSKPNFVKSAPFSYLARPQHIAMILVYECYKLTQVFI